MIQSIISFVVAFGVSALIGRFLIPWLRALKAGQTIKEIGPKWHMSKQGTPTMGGIMFIAGILIAVLVAGWGGFVAGDFTALIVYLFALVFGIIGFIDDFFKVKFHKNEGLTAAQKFLLQLAAAIAFVVLLRFTGHIDNHLYIPFANITVHIPWAAYMVLAAFIIVGCVNSVNLTDGLDGLCGSVTCVSALGFMMVSAAMGFGGINLLSTALAAACLGFLVWNFYPAKVFMGDTGSMFLGGMVTGLAFGVGMPLILAFLGIIYICESMSVVLQVISFKTTGKRIFKMSPIHHHFEMCGLSEVKIDFAFSAVTAVGAVLAVLAVRFI